jgi:chromosomal replication initiation ATPase DnaA
MALARGRGARQLALDLGHAESFAREDFLQGPSNAAALTMIERWPDWPASFLALAGPEGAGKSHLAAIWAADAGARFLSGRALREANLPAALATGALVVEDLIDGEFDERSLFHLLNLAREQESYLMLTSRVAPNAWALSIPDLASRLRAIPVLALDLPDEPLLRAVLVKLFDDRQLQVDEALVGYLVPRLERSFAAARRAVAQLDSEALRQKRPVTRSLASEVLRHPS